MKLARQRSRADCGPVAVYNLARLMQLESAKGGYKATFAHFAKATNYSPRKGCNRKDLWRAARAEFVGTPNKLVRRRPSWRNVVNQLHNTTSPAVGIILWVIAKKRHHIVVVWGDHNRNGIWTANGAAHKAVVPIYLRCGSYWPTIYHPIDCHRRLTDFWQVVPRGA